MATKSMHWGYEKEWRLLRPTPGCYELPDGIVTAVITGCSISPDHASLVREWAALSRSKIEVYCARMTAGTYSLHIASQL